MPRLKLLPAGFISQKDREKTTLGLGGEVYPEVSREGSQEAQETAHQAVPFLPLWFPRAHNTQKEKKRESAETPKEQYQARPCLKTRSGLTSPD